jgi:hypothetical protein
MLISKKQKAQIRLIAEQEWLTQESRRVRMRERESLEVRERVIKRLSRDYKVDGVIGAVLFAIAVKFAAKVIEDMLREYFKEETTDER